MTVIHLQRVILHHNFLNPLPSLCYLHLFLFEIQTQDRMVPTCLDLISHHWLLVWPVRYHLKISEKSE